MKWKKKRDAIGHKKIAINSKYRHSKAHWASSAVRKKSATERSTNNDARISIVCLFVAINIEFCSSFSPYLCVRVFFFRFSIVRLSFYSLLHYLVVFCLDSTSFCLSIRIHSTICIFALHPYLFLNRCV